jgi:UPF0716 protein FxsA
MPIFALFLIVPLIEIALFITVGGWLTLWPTLGLVVLTAFVGSVMVRQQGLAVIGQLQRSMGSMTDPLAPLGHGALIVLAGMLLITPGFFTDALGFSLLVPAVRSAILRQLAARVVVVQQGMRSAHTRTDADVIEGEFEEVDPDETRHGIPRKPSGWTRPPDH